MVGNAASREIRKNASKSRVSHGIVEDNYGETDEVVDFGQVWKCSGSSARFKFWTVNVEIGFVRLREKKNLFAAESRNV